LLGGIGGTYLLARTGAVAVTSSGTPVRSGSAGGPKVTVPSGAAPTVTRSPGTVAAVAAAVLPSVVQIEITAAEGQGSGSGFLIDDQGHVLTNNHVVSAADNPALTVVFDDGSQQKATVVGKDASYDLAVLKVDAGGRKPLPFGDSDAAVVGDPVIAIGAPLGLQSTVTTGIVSAKNRPVSAGESQAEASYMNAIQTDAAINPGNSGGPLVDLTGAVIGVNSAIARAPGSSGNGAGNIGLGFAIPSNQAERIAEMLITKGVAEHPIIGVGLDGRYTGEGVKVLERATGDQVPVVPGGPADKAGIQAGDIIVAIDGRPVTSSVELIVAIRAKAVGETAQLTVRRGSRELNVTVTLVAAPKTS
jgi:putative serine protease PepD